LAVSGNGAVILAGSQDVAALEIAPAAMQPAEIKFVVWTGVNRGGRFF